MQSSMVRRYADPGDYMKEFTWSNADVCITARGRFSAKRTRISLPAVLLHRFSEELPRVGRIVHAPRRALFMFGTGTGSTWFTGPAEVRPGAIVRIGKEDRSFQRSIGPFEFAGISMSIEDVETTGATYGAGDFMPPQATLIVSPAPSAMARLQRIHAIAGELAEHTPEVIEVPEAARGLEQALLAALAECLSGSKDGAREVGSRHRNMIMRRFHTLLETHPDGAVHTLEICKALGVSNRTLTTCCNESLGMSPYRYLKLRQLNLAHRALRRAGPEQSVTGIATQYGFWDLGRFAAAYCETFGELPSDTLGQRGQTAPRAREPEKFMLASEIT